MEATAYETRLAGLLAARRMLGLESTDVDDGLPVVSQPAHAAAPPTRRLSAAATGRLSWVLVLMVEAEPQRTCTLHAMQLLCDVPGLLDAWPVAGRGARLHRAARARFTGSRDDELRSHGLELIALSAPKAGADAEGSGGAAGPAAGVGDAAGAGVAARGEVQWAARLAEASAADQPVPLRLATTRAIGSSAALRASAGPASMAEASGGRRDGVGLWLIALALLEDDDDEVRGSMAAQLSPLVAPGRLSLHPAVVLQLGWMAFIEWHGMACPTVLDVLMHRIAGAPLGAPLGCTDGDAHFRTRALPPPAAHVGMGGGVGGKAGGARRELFEKEEDNQHVEPLQQAQLAARLLRRALGAMRRRQDAQQAEGTEAAALATTLEAAHAWRRELEGRGLRGGASEAAAEVDAEAHLWQQRVRLVLYACGGADEVARGGVVERGGAGVGEPTLGVAEELWHADAE